MTGRLRSFIVLVVLLGTLSAATLQQTNHLALPPTEWSNTYGGAGGASAASVVETPDEGHASVGYTYSFGARLDADFWLIKAGVREEVDVTPPTVALLSPENTTYPTKNVPLTFTVSESPSWTGYGLDTQMNVTVSGNTTLIGLADTGHTIRIYANDTAGNMGYSETVYFTVDTLAPRIEILSPEMRRYNTTSVALNIIINEVTSWIGYSVDGQANVTTTGNTTVSGLSDGLHGILVYAEDPVGNVGSSEVWFTVETPEPFPEILPLGIAAVIAGVGAAFLVYYAKIRKKKT